MTRSPHPSQMTDDEIERVRTATLPPDAERIGTGDPGLAIWTFASARRDGGVRPAAIGFTGRAVKPTFRYAFRDEQARAEFLSEQITRHHATVAAKAKRREDRKAEAHGLQPGDVLVCSWGYDQTNIDYYEVTRVMARAVEIRQLRTECVGADGYHDALVPVAGSYCGEPMRKVPRVYSGRAYVSITSYSSASKWEGRPMYQTDKALGH